MNRENAWMILRGVESGHLSIDEALNMLGY